jgi:glycosyltransferase involved in cell wall biosynthesis
VSVSRIKILYTIPNFDTAGSGKVVYDLTSSLDPSLFEVEIACTHSRGDFFKEVQKLGFPIHIMETTVKYRPYFSLLFRLWPVIRFFRKNKFDIIHSWHWSSDWTEVLAARLAGIKWVYTKKAMNWGNVHWKIKCYLASFIITVNDDMMNFFRYKRNQKLIPFGLNTDHYDSQPHQTHANGKVKLITVANLVAIKGIETILSAVSQLGTQSIQLFIVGDDTTPYAAMLKDSCQEYGITQQVTFTGKRLDVRSEMSSSTIYIISTLEPGEGMPMALVEAMSMGIPVLGSDVAGIRHVLKDFPEYLFKVGDPISLSQKIKEITNQSIDKRKIIGEKLRTYCVKKFSQQRFIDDHMNLYSSLVGKRI